MLKKGDKLHKAIDRNFGISKITYYLLSLICFLKDLGPLCILVKYVTAIFFIMVNFMFMLSGARDNTYLVHGE